MYGHKRLSICLHVISIMKKNTFKLREYIQQLAENEEAALIYNILYRTNSKKAHPELFGNSVWRNSFYRRLSDGEESLKRKKILDEDRNPTELAYQMLSTETLRDMLKKLRGESLKIAAKKDEIETKVLELKARCRDLQVMEKYKLINEIADKFKFLGVDENWIAVLICSNVVEQAIKKKLEDLGVEIKGEPPPSFKDIRRALGDVLKEKEGRKLEALFEPKELWRIRNRIDHWGYKLRFDKDKARAIFVMAKEIIDEIWRYQ